MHKSFYFVYLNYCQLSRVSVVYTVITILTIISITGSSFVDAYALKIIGFNESKITVNDERRSCGSSNFGLTQLLVKDIREKVISSSESGSQIMVEISVASQCVFDNYPVLILLEVEDKDGLTRYLAFQNFTMNLGTSYTAGFSWLSQDAADYKFGVFVHSCSGCSGDFGIIKWLDFPVNDNYPPVSVDLPRYPIQ
jgi:hypothetical protein